MRIEIDYHHGLYALPESCALCPLRLQRKDPDDSDECCFGFTITAKDGRDSWCPLMEVTDDA